ncbi:zinc finger HIT domain-containing protein 2 [Alligator mississippiensis]|uniref:Zinc finger HIT domain-containing protein 2 n=1 Tax=Alligator mississippiensis TaxID=8496 RepID=A0A151MTM8_ALLMI|nr:zinc finger HIT domain-containing protein 2 [Alligator mississippiensis]KYO27849.1 zinc finger HIT domain-containing protein 2 [Alligator mississippiensis]
MLPEIAEAREGGLNVGRRNPKCCRKLPKLRRKEPKRGVGRAPKMAAECGLCWRAEAPYTCPRCHLRLCSLPCYRGHGPCAQAFARRQLELRLRAQRADPTDRARLREALGRLRQLREPGDAEAALGHDALSPAQRDAFERLLASDRAAALLPPWRPWWWRRARAGGRELVQEVGDAPQPRGSPTSPQQTSGDPSSESGVAWTCPELENGELSHPQLLADTPGDPRPEPEVACTELELDNVEPRSPRPGGPPRLSAEISQGFGSEPNVDRTSPELEDVEPSPMPPVPASIPPLRALTRGPASPLVGFQLPNVLYAYAYALTLYHGEPEDDAALLLDFADTVLSVSGALGRQQGFGSIGEALQAAVHAVTACQLPECPLGNTGAILAVAEILRGESPAQQKDYTLTSLAHLARLLGQAKKQLPAAERSHVYRAKKKCEFLLSWVNDNPAALPLLALEAEAEYRTRMKALREVNTVTKELERMWGGKMPPPKTPLIEELD